MARFITPSDQATGSDANIQEARVMRIESSNGGLSADGHPLRIKGLTWWGAESAAAVPGGLQTRSLDDLLKFASSNDSNAIRLPFLHQHVLFDEPLPSESFSSALNS